MLALRLLDCFYALVHLRTQAPKASFPATLSLYSTFFKEPPHNGTPGRGELVLWFGFTLASLGPRDLKML